MPGSSPRPRWPSCSWPSWSRATARGAAAAADRRFSLAVVGMLVLATLVRLPALRAPGSLVSSDSAVAGIIAQELRAGHLPAPIYAPGFPYEGTLKPHLTALLGLALPGAGTPLLYVLASHLFYLLWVYAVMRLARGVGGVPAALGAGLFMAVSPRFLTAFSLNNVGQYPEVNALGTLALMLLTPGAGLLLPGFVLGLALWQQLLALYFILAAAAGRAPDARRCAARGCWWTASAAFSPAPTRSSSGTRPTRGPRSIGWGRGERGRWNG